MLLDEARMNHVIGRIYEAAIDSAQWEGVLSELSGALKGVAFQLYTIDSDTRSVIQQWDYGLPKQFIDEYRAYYSKLSDRNELMLRNPELTVVYDYLFLNEAEMDSSEMYHWRAGFDLRYFVGGRLHQTDSTLSMAAVQRSISQGHASQIEIEMFAALRPHLSRAVQIQNRFASLEQESNNVWAAIENASFGVVLLSTDLRILRCNREAERIMAEGSEIDGRGGRLTARRPIDDSNLQRLITAAAGTARGRGHEGGGSMALAKRASPRSYALLVAPVPEAPLSSSGPAVVVLLTDPDRTLETPVQLIRRIYGLTRKEAQLALALAAGVSLADAADELQITKGTARRHLAGIFARTGIHRQAELVRLVLSLPPVRPG